MRGLTVPHSDEDFAADQVELYFDLAFVFAFSQLVGYLVEHHTATGVAKGALVFVMLWLPWSQFTWSANAVSSSARVVRLLFLVATVASVPMAASVRTVFDDGGPVFAISVVVITAMALATMVSGVDTGSDVWRSALRYSVPVAVSLVAWVVGAFLDGDARVVAWAFGCLAFLVGAIQAGDGDWIVRSGHFAERHGLIVIIALGEIIVALAVPVVRGLEDGEGLPARTVAALIAAGVFAGLAWWSYFDRPAPALEHFAEGQTGRARGRYARDVYTFAHLPMVAGIVLSAAALEEITLHPTDPLDASFRWMLFGGLALFSAGWRSRSPGLFASSPGSGWSRSPRSAHCSRWWATSTGWSCWSRSTWCSSSCPRRRARAHRAPGRGRAGQSLNSGRRPSLRARDRLLEVLGRHPHVELGGRLVPVDRSRLPDLQPGPDHALGQRHAGRLYRMIARRPRSRRRAAASSATTRDTSPIPSASAASTSRPVSMISNARPLPIASRAAGSDTPSSVAVEAVVDARGPEVGGPRPRGGCRRPDRHMPPPTAAPLTAAIVGLSACAAGR